MKKLTKNIYDSFFKRKVPANPSMMEMTMSDFSELLTLINEIVGSYLAAKSRIAELESGNRSLSMRIKDLEDEAAADTAQKSAMADAIRSALKKDVGASMGGVE